MEETGQLGEAARWGKRKSSSSDDLAGLLGAQHNWVKDKDR